MLERPLEMIFQDIGFGCLEVNPLFYDRNRLTQEVQREKAAFAC